MTRPIEDFLERQATFCINEDVSGGTYVDFPADESKDCNVFTSPPIANTLNPTRGDGSLQMFVDYFNIHGRWASEACDEDFGTTIEGTIAERELKDGRALVSVKLTIRKALFWVVVPTGDPDDPTLYGTVRAQDICDDVSDLLVPSLAQITATFAFINTAPGDDLPDLIQIIFFPQEGQAITQFKIIANGKTVTGTNVHTTQIGLLSNKNCDNPDVPGFTSCFPSEIVIVGGNGRHL